MLLRNAVLKIAGDKVRTLDPDSLGPNVHDSPVEYFPQVNIDYWDVSLRVTLQVMSAVFSTDGACYRILTHQTSPRALRQRDRPSTSLSKVCSCNAHLFICSVSCYHHFLCSSVEKIAGECVWVCVCAEGGGVGGRVGGGVGLGVGDKKTSATNSGRDWSFFWYSSLLLIE